MAKDRTKTIGKNPTDFKEPEQIEREVIARGRDGTLGSVVYDEERVIETAVNTAGVYLGIGKTPVGAFKSSADASEWLFLGVQTNEINLTGGSTYNDDGMSKLLEEAVALAKTTLLSGANVAPVVATASKALDITKKLNSMASQASGYSIGSGGWLSRRTFVGSEYLTFTLSTRITTDMVENSKGSKKSIKEIVKTLYGISMPTPVGSAPNIEADGESGSAGLVASLGDIAEGASETFNKKIEEISLGRPLMQIVQNPLIIVGFRIGDRKFLMRTGSDNTSSGGFTLENFSVDISPYENEQGDYAWANIQCTIKTLERPLFSNLNFFGDTENA